MLEDVPKNYEDIKDRAGSAKWKNAIQYEIDSLSKNKIWTLLEKHEGAKVITCKWVFWLKKNADGEIQKYIARLVAKGFMQKKGFDHKETYAPVQD